MSFIILKVAAYKRSALESSQEIETLQLDLQRERERHLETLKDFRIVKERSAEMERFVLVDKEDVTTF